MQLPQSIYDVMSKMKNKWEWGNILLTRYTKSQIIDFLLKNYISLERKDKETMIIYISIHAETIDLNTFKYDDAVKLVVKKMRSERAKENTVANYLSKLNEDERNCFINERSQKMLVTRKSKYPELSDEDAIKKSYIDGLLTKGKKTAVALGIDPETLAPEELLKLSGYAKKENFKKLSYEQKRVARVKWKRSNLMNKNVRNTILTEYVDFTSVCVEELEDNEVEQWYNRYQSICSSNNIKNGVTKGYGIYGYFNSSRFGIIRYRSLLELKYLQLLDNNANIIDIKSEPFHIRYIDNNGVERRYCPDFIIYTRTTTILIEIKPRWKLKEFIVMKRDAIKKANFKLYILTELFDEDKLNERINRYTNNQ